MNGEIPTGTTMVAVARLRGDVLVLNDNVSIVGTIQLCWN